MVKSLFGYAKTTESIAKSGGWNIYDDKFKIASSDEYGNALLPVDKFAGMFLNSNHIAYYLTLFIGVSSTLFCVAKKLWLKIFSGLSFVFLSFMFKT